jgi:hypothetical protein
MLSGVCDDPPWLTSGYASSYRIGLGGLAGRERGDISDLLTRTTR